MTTGVFSFHRMREECLAGDPHGWRGFIRQYTPLARQLARHYFPELSSSEFLCEIFQQARAKDAALLRQFTGTSEGEFLFVFRQFVLTLGRRHRTQPPAAPVTLENLWTVLKQFPPLQREMVLLTFRGYAPEEINLIHLFEFERAEQILGQLVEILRAELGSAFRDDLIGLDHDPLFAQLEQQRTEECVPDRIYVRIVDGQINWREKENAEDHINACLYCLARFAEYRELCYFYKKLPPVEDALATDVAAALGLPSEEAQQRRGLTRLIPRLGRWARGVSK